jgi:hypothetical protein
MLDTSTLTVAEALNVERAAGRTITEIARGERRACVTCSGRPPVGFQCLRCGARRDVA